MLRIEIPSTEPSHLSFSKLERLNIPSPPNGFDQEINDDVVMAFEDEQEAIDYSMEIDRYMESLNDQSAPEFAAAGDIIKAIGEDEFVQSYIQS
jgi:hypothetical protein